jgi:hypothetical protein
MTWADGTTEWYGGAMIMFASPYAVPDKTWTEYPCLPLEHATPPARIVVTVNNYGQIGIEEVAIVWRGRRLVYRLERTAGRFVQMAGATPWLGPIGATVTDPTQRPDVDEAHYLPPPDAARG